MKSFAKLQADLEAAPGTMVAVSKADLGRLISAAEIGQRARVALTNIQTMVAIAASTAGTAA